MSPYVDPAPSHPRRSLPFFEYPSSNTAWRSFMSVAAGWTHHHSPSQSPAPNSRRMTHLRTQSNSPSPSNTTFSTIRRPRASTQTSGMAADASVLATPPNKRTLSELAESDFGMSTLPDPRSRSVTPAAMDGTSDSTPPHPDLNDEVATLSSKLIHAINHQTTLDDNLSQARAELEEAQNQIRSMEVQLEQQREMIAEEKKLRLEAEQEKKRIEQELENLTTALFEEANKMVKSAKEEARKDQDVVQRKNDLLKAQLADTEGLLRSQQDQLIELKQVLEQMTADRDDQTVTTTPSSPGYSKFSREDDTPTSDIGSQSGLPDLVTPSYPTSFTHLLQPVLRNDIAAYQDFATLCETSRRVSSRPASGSHTGLSLGLMASGASSTSTGIPSTASTASLSSSGSPAVSSTFSNITPITPASTNSSASATMLPVPPLKETKFYKRALAEDIEPTLRLDIAPGLSWLARRSVVAAMSDGSLVVEPVPTTGTYAKLSKPHLYACSLCGENRPDEEYLRRYRFRTSESSSAQRYPLCKYCLNRIRATCDFLGFLRMVKDGHWRTDDEDAEKSAWEESVRLRENMFWARIGGGVRPVSQGFHGRTNSIHEKSPRPSREDEAIRARKNSLAPTTDVNAMPESEKAVPQEDTPVISAMQAEESISEAMPSAAPAESNTMEEASDSQSVVVHDEPTTDVDDSKVDRLETTANLEPPRTPSPSPRDSNRISTQSVTPRS